MVSWCFSVMYAVVLCGIPINASIWQTPCAHNASGKLLLTPCNVNYIVCQCMFEYRYLYVCACILQKDIWVCLYLNLVLWKQNKIKKEENKETYFQSSVFDDTVLLYYLLRPRCLLTPGTVHSHTMVKRLWKWLAQVIASS